jgi:ligand-binding sensor domain-containing protein
MFDERGYLWVSDYGVGVYRFKLEGENVLTEKLLFTVEGGLPEEYIKSILSDDEGNVWFGSQSKGIAVLRNQAFTFYHFEKGIDIPKITALSLENGNNYFGSTKGLLIWANEAAVERKFYTPANGLPNDVITALWQDSEENVYIGAESSGIFRKKRKQRPWLLNLDIVKFQKLKDLQYISILALVV